MGLILAVFMIGGSGACTVLDHITPNEPLLPGQESRLPPVINYFRVSPVEDKTYAICQVVRTVSYDGLPGIEGICGVAIEHDGSRPGTLGQLPDNCPVIRHYTYSPPDERGYLPYRVDWREGVRYSEMQHMSDRERGHGITIWDSNTSELIGQNPVTMRWCVINDNWYEPDTVKLSWIVSYADTIQIRPITRSYQEKLVDVVGRRSGTISGTSVVSPIETVEQRPYERYQIIATNEYGYAHEWVYVYFYGRSSRSSPPAKSPITPPPGLRLPEAEKKPGVTQPRRPPGTLRVPPSNPPEKKPGATLRAPPSK